MRYKSIIEYNGKNYFGWQKQPDLPTIQGALETALEIVLKKPIAITASGRTDGGVHAYGQVIHFDAPEINDTHLFMRSINHFLKQEQIALCSVEKVTPDFHARFSAKKRRYEYHIINRKAPLVLDKGKAWHVPIPLDISTMQEAANHLIGNHDFSSFRDAECQAKSPIKTLEKVTITQNEQRIIITIEAPSFLHHMVRNITGTLKNIGEGKWTSENMLTILQAKDRTKAGMTAPAEGLYFMQVTY